VRPVPPGWGPPPRPGWGFYPPLPGPRRPALSGVTVLVLVTVLAALAAPHAHQLRGMVEAGAGALPAIRLPQLPQPPAAPDRRPSPRAARAVAYALAQRGKPYRWGARGPDAFDCSGLTWAAWRAAGVAIPRTAAGQLAGLPPSRVVGSSRATW
jgi:peptidoglycan DL-endopeptidase CwlO